MSNSVLTDSVPPALTSMSTRYVLRLPGVRRRNKLTCEQKFEFTPEGITKRAVATIEFYKDVKPLRSPLNRAFEQLI
jgi:hypothetical protein